MELACRRTQWWSVTCTQFDVPERQNRYLWIILPKKGNICLAVSVLSRWLVTEQYIPYKIEVWYCNGDYFSKIFLRSRIPPPTPRDPVIPIKPPSTQRPRSICLSLLWSSSIKPETRKQSLSPEPRLKVSAKICFNILLCPVAVSRISVANSSIQSSNNLVYNSM